MDWYKFCINYEIYLCPTSLHPRILSKTNSLSITSLHLLLKGRLKILWRIFIFTGEARFCLLFSDDMSTGKTSAMLSLCYGQEASSDSGMMLSVGDGRKVGTTV